MTLSKAYHTTGTVAGVHHHTLVFSGLLIMSFFSPSPSVEKRKIPEVSQMNCTIICTAKKSLLKKSVVFTIHVSFFSEHYFNEKVFKNFQ